MSWWPRPQSESSPNVAQMIRAFESHSHARRRGCACHRRACGHRTSPASLPCRWLGVRQPPGSRHRKRYEDVEELLEAGISVLTSINLEYIAEQQEFVRSILGKTKAETVPQEFIDRADEVVVVDAPPEADEAIGAHQLSQLRQRALLLTADVVDRQLEAYLRLHGIQSSWGTQERILVCMTPRANAPKMLASGRRNADRFHGELFAIYVTQDNLTPEDRHGARAERHARTRAAGSGRNPGREGPDQDDSRVTRGTTASPRSSWATTSAAPGGTVWAARRSTG